MTASAPLSRSRFSGFLRAAWARLPGGVGWAVLALGVTGLALVALHGLLREVAYDDVVVAIGTTSAQQLGWAALATILSYLALTGYDFSSLRYVGAKVPTRLVMLTSFVAFALGNTVGLGVLTGGAVRMRLYSAAGVEPAAIARAIGFNAVAFGFGLTVVGAVSLLLAGGGLAATLGVPLPVLQVGAATALLLALLGIGACFRLRQLRLGDAILIPLPRGSLASGQLLVSSLEILTAGMVLWALLPHAGLHILTFIACYAVAISLGVISHVPGGLGVFEAVMLVGVGDVVPREQLAGALVLYRCIYYLAPLALALMLLVAFELRRSVMAPVVRAAAQLSPLFLAVTLFVTAVMLLVSGALPATDDATELLALHVPLPLVEAAHLISSLAGLLMLFVVRGILQRLDASWWAALFISGIGFVLALPKGFSLLEMAILGFLSCMLILSRHEFDRRASLFALRFTAEWWMLVASVLALTLWILFYAYRDVDYAHPLWWQFEFDAHAPRSLRAALAIILLTAGVAFWQMFRPAPLAIPRPDDAALAQMQQIVAAQPRADAALALMGDKHLLFSRSGRAFLMYGQQGRSLVALFDPVGPVEEWQELVWRFKELADERAARAAFYQIRPADLSLYLDAGFQVFKLGEYASVPLPDFNLQGARRAPLRHACNRAEREGLSLRVVEPSGVAELLAELKAVSDAWLAAHGLNEKGFSLGRFDPEYLQRNPVALVKKEGRILAFASLLRTDAMDEASVDLMRHLPDVPPGTMEFLFVRLIQHFQTLGYQRFGLGMAPLSGMADHPLAPAWHRVARLLFAKGEQFYGFRGLRNFKEKFAPQWEARYLAATGNMDAVKSVVDVAVLIGGGLRKVVAG